MHIPYILKHELSSATGQLELPLAAFCLLLREAYRTHVLLAQLQAEISSTLTLSKGG